MAPLPSWLASVLAYAPALPSFTPVMLFGLIGVALGSSWALLRGRRAILLCQAGCSMAFAVHYVLLGADTAPFMCALSVVQAAVALPERRPVWAGPVYIATVLAAAAISAATWQGLPSACAAFGLSCATLGRWQTDTLRLRLCFLGSTAGWMSHNIMMGSAFGLSSDTLGLAGNLWGLWLLLHAARPAVRPVPFRPTGAAA